MIKTKEFRFVEAPAGAFLDTPPNHALAVFTLPDDAVLIDIQVVQVTAWSDSTGVNMWVGEPADSDLWTGGNLTLNSPGTLTSLRAKASFDQVVPQPSSRMIWVQVFADTGDGTTGETRVLFIYRELESDPATVQV